MELPLVTNYKRGWKDKKSWDIDEVNRRFLTPLVTDEMAYSELVNPDAMIKPHVDVDISGADLTTMMSSEGEAFDTLTTSIKLQWVDRLAACFKIPRAEIAVANRHKPPGGSAGGKISFHLVVNTICCEAQRLGQLMGGFSDLPGFDPNIYIKPGGGKRVFTCVECYKPGERGIAGAAKMTRETHKNCLRRHFVNYMDKGELEDAQDLTPQGEAADATPTAPIESFALHECSSGPSSAPRVVAVPLVGLTSPKLRERLVQMQDLTPEEVETLQVMPGSVQVPMAIATTLRTLNVDNSFDKLTITIGCVTDRTLCCLRWRGGSGYGVATPEEGASCDMCNNTLIRLNDDFEDETCPCAQSRRCFFFWIPSQPVASPLVTAHAQRLALEAGYFGGEEKFTRRLQGVTQSCKRARVDAADDEDRD